MAKKMKNRAAQHYQLAAAKEEKPATLGDMLRPEMLDKLKAAGQELKSAEEARKEEARKREAEARAAEKKRQENDFEYLLNNTKMDWRSHKS
ncbi:uncharacterized protein DUF3886 [Paenibacillus taihuensis]|uniref:Uncharacterized protein DUF3886 n=1 Tax=Paenibacillus taihuensis TaxID=1156355 RepID=A0A3D9RMV6_9BACL|nr:YqkE family protein [Paenibacillus taihuensis]REE81220.1 uncharacterized protein DUF3886 [Paenibacillus taihuensis]